MQPVMRLCFSARADAIGFFYRTVYEEADGSL
jgi:hypothetical protein